VKARKPLGLADLRQAFDELAYGSERTLNLRAHLPTRAQAVQRCEAWLRERQASGAREVLVVTGRGERAWTA
jgi:DNA-nicking Smr family endonuclease